MHGADLGIRSGKSDPIVSNSGKSEALEKQAAALENRARASRHSEHTERWSFTSAARFGASSPSRRHIRSSGEGCRPTDVRLSFKRVPPPDPVPSSTPRMRMQVSL